MNAHQYYDSIKAARNFWRDTQEKVCMYCLEPETTNNRLQIHEIQRRSSSVGRWGVVCNYLLLHEACHSGPFATMPHATQLAIKKLRDSSSYDLEQWLRIKDPTLKAPDRVTQTDVDREHESGRSQ